MEGDALNRLFMDLILLGIGLGLTALGTLYGQTFGDGATVGAGTLLIGAGVRGLLAVEDGPSAPGGD